MKTVKLSLLAVVVATAVSPSAFAGDTVEAATTELTVIQPGMSQSEIDQKIGRFLERTGNSVAAQNYLIAHDYQTNDASGKYSCFSRTAHQYAEPDNQSSADRPRQRAGYRHSGRAARRQLGFTES
ncbi:putative adhesin [Escherichia coli]|uniref:Putative adhesin n=1 Tax=Escherichia coli TaxID=562 RepID=A0A376VP31_ECOLX|nr:putative adhesin [Escherichia coli]